MRPQDILIGSVISFIVSGLKRIPFVKKYPKTTSAILSTAIPAGVVVYGQIKGVNTDGVTDVLASIATQFSSAVATHEAVTHQVNKVTGKEESEEPAPTDQP